MLAITGGEVGRDTPDAGEIEAPELGMTIPSPSPTPEPLGRLAMESGRVADVRDEDGECEGEKVPSDGDA